MSKFVRLVIVSCLGLLMTACGSLTTRERHQFVLIRSAPPGADIFYNGEKVGVTPAFIEIRRAQTSLVQLADGKRLISVPIDSRYRWDGSFWTNLVFFYFAPLGWLVDYSTGASWNMEDPALRQLKSGTTHVSGPAYAAIAPPQSPSSEIADEGALLWERHLRGRYPNLIVLPYQEKLNEFTSHGYDFDTKPGRRTEHELFGRLAVNEIFESESKETAEGIELKGHFRNVFTGQKGPEEVIRAAPTEEDLTFVERFKRIFHLVPNTVGIELSKSDVILTDQQNSYQSVNTYDNTVMSQVAPWIAALDLTRQTPPRREGSGKFNFEFVPAIRATYRRIEFPTLAAVQFNEFSYLTVGAGLGPEIGWQWGPNYIYLNYIPIFGWHRLAWETEDGLNVYSVGALTFRGEAGYLYYLNEHFSFRLFGKSTTTPGNIWNEAIQNISPGSPAVDSGTDVSFGVVFGYTWGIERNIHNWKIFN